MILSGLFSQCDKAHKATEEIIQRFPLASVLTAKLIFMCKTKILLLQKITCLGKYLEM